MNGILTEIINFRCDYVGSLYQALTTVDEGRPVEAGLAYLKGLPARDVALGVVRSSCDDIVVVVSPAEAWSRRGAELQIHMTSNPRVLRSGKTVPEASILYAPDADGVLHRYELPRELAVHALRRVLENVGARIACIKHLVPYTRLGLHMEPKEDNEPLFLGLAVDRLDALVTQAMQERFAPTPKDHPITLRREHPWSAADHEVPAGRIVEDILDVPYAAVFTAAWDNPAHPDQRGVSPLMTFIEGAHVEGQQLLLPKEVAEILIDGEVDDEVMVNNASRTYDRTRDLVGATRYVIHNDPTFDRPSLRKMGAHIEGDKVVSGTWPADPFKVERTLSGFMEGAPFKGALPGAPKRRIRWDHTDTGRRLVLEEKLGRWHDTDVILDVEQPTNETDIAQAEAQLLAHAGLCRTDISNRPAR